MSDNVSAKKTGQGESSGLFQFDVEEAPTQKMRNWIEEQFLKFCRDNDIDGQGGWIDRLFTSGKFFEYSIQLWFEPGYFLVYDVMITFDKVETAHIGGESIAPYRLYAFTSFEYPIGVRRSLGSVFRYQQPEELPSALNAIGVSLNLHATSIFLSEVVTQ